MNPQWAYPQFRPLDLDCKPIFDAAFKDYPPQISEFTFTNLYSWRQVYGYQFCLLKDALILRADTGKAAFFLPPIGRPGTLAGPVKQILLETNIPFCRVPEELVLALKEDPALEILEDRDDFDYLYTCSELIDLGGRKYDGKRNQIKKFKAEYEYNYQGAGVGAKEILELEESWCGAKSCDAVEGLNNERRAIREIAEHFREFTLFSGVIRIKDKICALAIAERLNPETLVMHVLKADPSFAGLYQVMLNDFLRADSGDFKYVNLEQDLGIPGLRASKQSYQPVKLIKKYTLSLKK